MTSTAASVIGVLATSLFVVATIPQVLLSYKQYQDARRGVFDARDTKSSISRVFLILSLIGSLFYLVFATLSQYENGGQIPVIVLFASSAVIYLYFVYAFHRQEKNIKYTQ
jgi:uncharacterized protein with PQ loop repeat